MPEYWLPLANVLSATVLMGCYVVVLLVINGLAEGRARVLALLGLAVLFSATALGTLNGILGPWLTFTYGEGVDIYGLWSILVAGLGGFGLVLFARAIIAARRSARPPRGH